MRQGQKDREKSGGRVAEGDFDYLGKVIIIGDSGVGKSNLLLRYASDSFVENHMATIGLNYVFKIENIDDIRLKMQIWDTAGQDKFKTITRSYYRNSQGVLVVFSLDDRQSFNSVQKWMEDLSDTTQEQTRVLLLGNKNDLQAKREVTLEEAHHLAQTYGVEFMDCSAKTGHCVDLAFQKLGRDIKRTFIDDLDLSKQHPKDTQLKIKPKHWREKCCQK